MNEQVRRFGGKAMSEVGETIRFLAGVVAVWFVLVTFVFAAFHIPSESMQPAIQVGDRVLVSKFAYGYSRHSLPLGLGYGVVALSGVAAVLIVLDPQRRLYHSLFRRRLN